MNIKRCKRCKEEKPATTEYFHKSKRCKYGVTTSCKECRKQECIDDKERIDERNRKHHQQNKDKISQRKKAYWLKTKDKQMAYNKKWKKENKERRNKWERERSAKLYREDEVYRTHSLIATAMHAMLRGERKTSSTTVYLGCSVEELVTYLNKSRPDTNEPLHIDHIIPKSLYSLSESDLKKCWNYANLRLISASSNLAKSDTLDMDLVRHYDIEDLLP